MFITMLETTNKIRDTIKATPAPYLMLFSGVASEKMKMAIIRAE